MEQRPLFKQFAYLTPEREGRYRKQLTEAPNPEIHDAFMQHIEIREELIEAVAEFVYNYLETFEAKHEGFPSFAIRDALLDVPDTIFDTRPMRRKQPA